MPGGGPPAGGVEVGGVVPSGFWAVVSVLKDSVVPLGPCWPFSRSRISVSVTLAGAGISFSLSSAEAEVCDGDLFMVDVVYAVVSDVSSLVSNLR